MSKIVAISLLVLCMYMLVTPIDNRVQFDAIQEIE